jgi:uncharacterized protein YqgC (DUF456 family)
MDIVLLILCGLLLAVGIAGCIIPALPGPPLSFLALIVYQFTSYPAFSAATIVILGLITVAASLADYYLPIIGTKYSGGTKNGNIGAGLGLLIGFFVLPGVGVIIGPFVGAVVGEVIGGKKFDEAMKIGFGTLVTLLAGIFMKLALSLAITAIFLLKIIPILF